MSLIEPAAAPRIAIFWGREDLLGKAIATTLARASDWRLIKIADDFDVGTLTREIERLKPEVLFMSIEHCDEEVPVSVCAMEDNPNLRIIIINPCSNRVEVFTRKLVWIHEMSDLLSIINDQSDCGLEGGNSKT